MSKCIFPSVLRTSLVAVCVFALTSVARAGDGAAGQTLKAATAALQTSAAPGKVERLGVATLVPTAPTICIAVPVGRSPTR